MLKGMCQILDVDDGCSYPQSARYRAEMRHAAVLPDAPTIPDDVIEFGAINDTLDDERSYMEDGR